MRYHRFTHTGIVTPSLKILLAGYYGYGNAGDEAILDALTGVVRREFPDARLTVFSGDPGRTAETHGVNAVPWSDPQAIQSAVQACDRVIIGGGGLFHDYWGVDPERLFLDGNGGMGLYLAVALWAALYGKPLVLYGVGVGPLFSGLGRDCARSICTVAEAIVVRDAASRELLVANDVAADKIRVGVDCVWMAGQGSVSPAAREDLRIAVVPRFWSFTVDPAYWEQQVARSLDRIVEEHGAKIVMLPFQHAGHERENDRMVAERISDLCKRQNAIEIAEDWHTIPELRDRFGEFDLVIGMRYHAVVFSVLAGVPVVSLGYDPKVSGLMKELGLGDSDIPMDQVRAESLSETVNRALAPHDAKPARDVFAGRASSMAALLREVLEAPTRSAELGPREHEFLAEAIRQMEQVRADLAGQVAAALEERKNADARILELSHWADQQTTQIAELDHNLRTAHAEIERGGVANRELSIQLEAARIELTRRAEENREIAKRIEAELVRHSRETGELRRESESRSRADEARIRELVEWADKQTSQIQMLDRRLGELLAELDYAYRSRDQLATTIERRRFVSRIRRVMQSVLNIVQEITPEFARRAVRPVYLPLYRKFVKRAAPIPPPAPRVIQPVLTQAAAATPAAPQPPTPSPQPPVSVRSLTRPSYGPKVSVILPVWNHAELLDSAIASVLAQTYTNLEMIVVDDGSTTDLRPIVARFHDDPRFRFVRRPHEGLPRTLSSGFRLATGEFFTWTSADNMMHPNMLATLVDFLLRRPDLAMTYGDMDLIDAAGEPARNSNYRVTAQRRWATNQLRLPRTVATLGLINDNFIGGCFLYRAAIGRAIGEYDYALLGTEDYDYWLRVSAIAHIEHVDSDECLYSYRVHDDSLSGRHAGKIANNAEELIRYHHERLEFYREPFDLRIEVEDPFLAQTFPPSSREAAKQVTLRQGPHGLVWNDWHLCRSTHEVEQLPAEGVLNYSLLPYSNLSFRDELLLSLKARDNFWPLWDLPEFEEPLVLFLGPLAEEFFDWQAMESLIKSRPDATFLFISNDPAHEYNPAQRIASDRIRFLGYKRQREWHPYLSRAAVVIAPFRDAPGLEHHLFDTLMTYVAAGKLVLATPAIGICGFLDLPNTIVCEAAEWAVRLDEALKLRPDFDVADRYLSAHSPEAVANFLFGVANTRLFYAQTRAAPPRETKRPACLLEVSVLDRGGLERVVYNQAVDLMDHGYAVSIAAVDGGGQIAEECRAHGITVHETGRNTEKFCALLKSESIDILIPHYSFFGSSIAFEECVPVLSIVHNSYVWTGPEHDHEIRVCDASTTHYVAVSQTARSYFCRKYGVDPSKVTEIPNGIDTAAHERALQMPPTVTRAKLGIGADDFVLLTVGSIIGTKAQVHAIAAVRALSKKYPALKLILLGSPADEHYTAVVRQQIREYGLDKTVLLCPPTDAVADYYRLADAFLMTSITEGWSLAVTEAMFFGLPMILTDTGGTSEVIENGDIGIVVPTAYDDPLQISAANLWDACTNRAPANLTAIVSAIEDFYQRREYWKQQGRIGREKVLAHYDVKFIAARHRRAIEEVLARYHGTGKYDFQGAQLRAKLPQAVQ